MRVRRTKEEIAAGVTLEQKKMSQGIVTALEAKKPTGPLKRFARKPMTVPVFDDPKKELRRLVGLHRAWLKKKVAIGNMHCDKSFEDGTKLIDTTPPDIAAQMTLIEEAFKTEATRLERLMLQELKKFSIYTQFLELVPGCGTVTSAYLLAMVDIHKAVKPSQLRRYCGYAVIDGKLERRQRGVTGSFNDTLRTVLYNTASSMLKIKGQRGGQTNKYIDVYEGSKHREQSAGRTLGSHAKSWHKMISVFLEDLYIVWRTLEGLDVWPAYHAAKLGLVHEGRIGGHAPIMMTLDQAMDAVGSLETIPVLAEAAE